MVKPFEDATVSTPVGQISQPVRTQFGWHLIHRTG
jgi:parvulin-like peptidyl-prolyl isomerase